ncbi:UDP-N-acetylmuramoyl-tripeptide--D-alanyl-D-alanine ligase [Acidimicrobiia bacterium EGI L10123]|uniref:UDP-N-acetylmuramoyl-tripeptide--D-alanyl-D- alanine ligase n=1 Tax=Salinilacustrithrix flava TaxID=2957203 RepID=UPI003D7C185B|nr:UDP-N-acetylmuramoyl-tripeptide--D-alanyl-D-alanine ligase [Acidimicrobiia bacterium EGI L10123]
MELTIDEVAAAVRGEVVGPPTTISGACIDSRLAGPGQLFVPLVAERDGHDFIPAAIEAGAAACLTSREPLEGTTAVLVDDTMRALTRLGSVARDRLPEAVTGITGSVGKTSVKDLLAAALATTYRTAASEKSFNNEIGVPLTLVNAPDGTERVVLEMGARGIGHIRTLCDVARPTVAIVTMVAEVHTSEYEHGLDDVARAKGELVEAIPVDGHVILNGSDARVRAMASRTDARVLTYGVSGDVVAQRVDVDEHLRPRFRLSSPWGTVDVQLAVHGVHQVGNALAAAAAALVQDVPLEAVAEGLGSAALSPWRMELGHAASGATVLNDAYNSNPTALAAALHSLAALDAGRRVAVLGVMAELGDGSDERHAEMGELAEDLGIEVVTVDCPAYGVGTDVPTVEAAVDALGSLGPDHAVLVKASRSAGLERVATLLLG